MLTRLVTSNLRLLSFGMRDHALLLQGMGPACEKVFKAADHTCHVCGVRSERGMEIDHAAGHIAGKAAGLRAICQFCHNLHHPLWAASHGKIIPIWADDIEQAEINLLSWMMLTWQGSEPVKVSALRSLLAERNDRFLDTFGCATAEGLFEAAFTSSDTLGMDRAKIALGRIDRVLRFVPAEVMLDPEKAAGASRASRLSTWTIGGFRTIARMTSRTMLEDHDPEAAKSLAAAGVADGEGESLSNAGYDRP